MKNQTCLPLNHSPCFGLKTDFSGRISVAAPLTVMVMVPQGLKASMLRLRSYFQAESFRSHHCHPFVGTLPLSSVTFCNTGVQSFSNLTVQSQPEKDVSGLRVIISFRPDFECFCTKQLGVVSIGTNLPKQLPKFWAAREGPLVVRVRLSQPMSWYQGSLLLLLLLPRKSNPPVEEGFSSCSRLVSSLSFL